MKDYQVYTQHLRVRFRCRNCGKVVSEYIEDVPSPNWSGDTVDSSMNWSDKDFLCPHCKSAYTAEMYTNIYYGDIRLIDQDSKEEFEDFELKEINIDDMEYQETNNKAETWLKKKIQTQYKDREGFSCLDGQSGIEDVTKMAEDLGIDTQNKSIYAFAFCALPNSEGKILCTFHTKQKNQSIEDMDNIDQYLSEESYEVTYDYLCCFVKRLNVGFLIDA